MTRVARAGTHCRLAGLVAVAGLLWAPAVLTGCGGGGESAPGTPSTTVAAPPPAAAVPPDPYERNAEGFRDDHDYAIAKPDGVKRVVILGDSMAFGWGVDLDEGVAAQLQKRLPAGEGDSPRWEVLNLSQPAFNTSAEVALLKDKGLVYDPDVVVLAYSLDDALSGQETELGDVSETAHLLAGSVLGTLDDAARARVQTYLAENGWEHSLDRARQAKPSSELDATYFVGHDVPLYWEPVQNRLKELAGLAKADHFRVVVAIIPALGRPWDGYPFRDLHARIAAEMTTRGFEVIDFLPLLSAQPSEEVTQGGGYPNAKAHALMAGALAAEITGPSPRAGH
jgi:lysophospholipase L1-like esterase